LDGVACERVSRVAARGAAPQAQRDGRILLWAARGAREQLTQAGWDAPILELIDEPAQWLADIAAPNA
jgi:hypothetical protein